MDTTLRIDTGDTAFVLLSAALVMLMTPGLALFYGGMVRKKNVLSTIMHSFILAAAIGIQWALVGYTLAFGPSQGGVIGSLDWALLSGVGGLPNGDYAKTIPHAAFMIYQGMFAAITPALISGAFAERIRFAPFLVFSLLWATLVYDPLAHWVWGVGGFLRTMGALDFAGGTVVHISSGAAAVAAVIALGPRRGFMREPVPPHSLPLTITGAALLWFGWFGFNAGSALGSGALATTAFVATHLGACGATIGWLVIEWWHRGKPTVLGAASGAIAGLVAITPAAGFVSPSAAIVIGFVGGIVCYFGVTLKTRLGYDDALDAIGIHGFGGTWGAIATGLFATKAVNPDGGDGLLAGNASLVGIQLAAVGITIAFSFVVSLALFTIIKKVVGLRPTPEDEIMGLDLTEHGEAGYN
ncbi:MAG: ammonium transporter [Deltaproteobacteria bacterium]|nr:ammonium transporter [Deltaproteobacteria bacterium]